MRVRRLLLAAAILFGSATLLGLIEATQTFIRAQAMGSPFSWPRTIADNVSTWMALAAMAPLAFAMSRRLRLERPFLGRRVALHMAAGLVFGLIAAALVAAVIVLRKPDLAFLFMATKVGTLYVIYYLVIYWAIVGAEHALHFHRQAQARQLAATQLEEQLVRGRLELLRSKLNPHFLFNTLNAISTMALQRDSEAVAQSLGLVGDMLRASLDDSMPQTIPLERELELVQKYVAIQRLRFGDRLRVEQRIDPRSLDALIPSMLLQPIVENAIVHGVAAQPGEGWVRIETNANDGELTIAVSDSGRGFDGDPRQGIGLANTRERLATMYGDAHRFAIGNAEGGGARVEISIPVQRGTA